MNPNPKSRKVTLQDIQNSACGHLNPHLNDKAPKPTARTPRKPSKRSKSKQWINTQLWVWCRENGLELKTEQTFHEYRKWRFDWQIPALMIGIEYNGIFSDKSRHTTVTGYTGDMEKLNAAQSLGWTVLQYTPLNYKNLITDLDKIKP